MLRMRRGGGEGGAIELREQAPAADRPSDARAPLPVAERLPNGASGRPVSFVAPASLALALGLWGITRQSTMWRDESVTYQVAHRTPSEIWALLDNADAVHGLYYFLMHALYSLWEGGLVTLRLPSVLAVAAAAGLVGLMANRIAGRRAGVVSGLVFALTPEVQMYAQEGRSYAMVCALVALATWLLARALTGPSAPRRWALYSLAVLAASWLHEFAVLTLMAHGVTVLLARTTPRVRRCWAVAAGAAVIGLVPLVLFSVGQSGQVSWIGGPKPREWLEITGVALVAVLCARYPAATGAGSVLVARLALPLALLPTAVLLLAAVHEPMYVDRYVLFTNVGFSLLVGTALSRLYTRASTLAPLRGRSARFAAVGASAAAVVLALTPVTLQMRTPDSRKDDVTAIAEEVQRVSAPGDGVLFAPSRRREWRLSYPGEFGGLVDLALEKSPKASASLQGEELPAAGIRSRMLALDRIVVLSDPPDQPQDAVEQEAVKREVLRTRFHECSRTQLKGAQVTVYARSKRCEAQ
ncbi:glycosyltransferase family 39 protein [Streptomyces xantholiticus]|uniref:Glycosyltransferase family 39 protein n=1 Tax=Streptomyces xantholiticus TaxID=68285 RepID=A0ABV1V541_9ACTN